MTIPPAVIAAGGFIGDAILGSSAAKKARRATYEGIRWDLQAQKDMFDYRIQRGQDEGMTAYEMFMGPAAGAGGGTTGTGQALGNQAMQQAQMRQEAFRVAKERALDRQTDLAKTQMQTDAQKYSADRAADATTGAAGIGAKASVYGSTLRYLIDNQQLKLNQRTFEEVTLPAAAENLNLTKEQTRLVINQIATSEPEFVKFMKFLTMGPENIKATFPTALTGINPAKPETVKNATKEERERYLSLVLGLTSNTLSEGMGAQQLLQDTTLQLGTGLGETAGKADQALGDTLPKVGNRIKKEWQDFGGITGSPAQWLWNKWQGSK